MESILKSDIFFAVSTVATIVLTILVSIVLIYAIRTARLLLDSSKIIKTKVTQAAQGIDSVHGFVKKMNVVQFIRSAFQKKKASTKKQTHN